MTSTDPLSRRDFVLAGVVGCALALSGCSWAPRNAGSQLAASSSRGGAQAGPSGSAAAAGSKSVGDDGLIFVHGGTFTMGSPPDEPWRSDDEVLHEVALSDFFLSPTEVSQLEYNTLMGLGGGEDGIPVTGVTWYDTIAYCNALSVEAVELVCERPYSTDYNVCLDEAQRDQNQQARPVLTTRIDDMGRYGTVYLGYPNWWASIPMPIATFLESYDFTGKEIRPFCSNGGGGLGQSVTAISKLAPAAHVGQGLSIYYSGGSDMPKQVADWIAG